MTPGRSPRAMGVYRLLLRLLPRELRRTWGEEMEAVLARRLEEADSRRGRAGVWVRAAVDVVVQAVAARAGGAIRARRRADAPESTVLSRERRGGGGGMERLVQDVRYAVRSLRKAPAFTVVAVLTLTLGIGAVTAVFTVVNAVLLRPLPYPEPERLVSVWPEENFNTAMIDRIAAGVPALEGVSGVSGWELSLEGDGEPARLEGAAVSWNHFDVLGVQPILGRGFLREERDPARSGVVILSHDLWVERYGADPDIVGRTLRIGGREYTSRTVVGVMGADFRPVEEGREPAVWVPLDVPEGVSVQEDDTWYVNTRVARLAPGATLAVATEQLRQVAASLREEMPAQFEEEDVVAASLQPLKTARVGDMDRTLRILLGAVALVLLIACANVANLLLARGEARERDLAVRQALGAHRWRLVRQLLTESLVLGLVGGTLAVLLAWWGVSALMGMAPPDFPRADEVRVDGAVLATALVVSVLSALVFGTVPALRASAGSRSEALRSGGRNPAASRVRTGASRWLVAAEVALAVILVTGSGLMLRTMAALADVDPGYDPENVLAARVVPPSTRYVRADYAPFYEQALEAVRAVPGVTAASGIHLLPSTVGNWSFPVFPEGLAIQAGQPPPVANFRIVQPGWFETMGIPVLRGRTFTDRDRADGPRLMVVNRSFAERHWPGEDAVGRRVGLMGTDRDSQYEVIGVVGDVHQAARDQEPQPEIYVSHRAQWGSAVSFWFVVRTAGDPLALADRVRAAIWSVDPGVPVTDVDRMERVLDRSAASTRFVSLLLGLFGGIALLLGAVGVYGVTSYTVARRVPEFGVRMALGAPRPSILRSALVRGMLPVAAGLLVGMGLATWGAGVMESLVFGVPPRDPLTLASVAGLLALTAVAATAVPALRATRVDPARVLQEE